MHRTRPAPASNLLCRASSKLGGVAAAVAMGLCQAAAAESQDPDLHAGHAEPIRVSQNDTARPIDFEIAEQPLSEALMALGAQSGLTIIVETKVSKGLRAAALSGRYTPEEALKKLLEPAGLEAEYLDSKTVAVRPAQSPVHTTSANAQEATLEEVIVTATKRAESVQSVPISITALDTRKLEAMGAVDYESFVRTIPGLSYNDGQFTMRGVATTNFLGNTQSTVAIYLDDLPALSSFGAPLTPDLRLFDIERVEILRGPQGTLFGSGALGGAVRVITVKPDAREFAAKFEGTLASTKDGDPSHGVNGMVNIPLIDGKLAMRAVAYDARDGGYIDNVRRNERDVNEETTRGGRLAFKATPNESLTLLAVLSTQRDEADDAAYAFTESGSREFGSRTGRVYEARQSNINFAVEYAFSGATLTSSTNYARQKVQTRSDLTDSYAFLFEEIGATPLPVYYSTDTDEDFLSQELRLSSNGDGRFNWLAGAFYLRRTTEPEPFRISSQGAGALFAEFGYPSDDLYLDVERVPGTERALFGEVSYALTPEWTLTAGLRAFRNESQFHGHSSGYIYGPEKRSYLSTENDAVTPKFAIDWRPNDRLMVYGQAAQGYRVGQNNFPVPPDPDTGLPRVVPYDSDSLWNYEIGVKADWLDRRLRTNIATYYIDWRDIQIDAQYDDGFNYIINAGKARSQGVEFEVEARPIPQLVLTTAFSYVDAELVEDTPLGAPKGSRLPGSSDFQVANSLQYGFALPWGGVSAYVRAEHEYMGRVYSELDNAAGTRYGDYNVASLRLGVERDRWEVVCFVNNLLDSKGMTRLYFGDEPHALRLRPRAVGITIRSNF